MENSFHPAIPILPVRNLNDSIVYFREALGFSVDWIDPSIMASVSRQGCHFMLCEGDQGHSGTWAYIGIENVDALFEEFRKRNAKIRKEPTNYWWGYEMHIYDLDDNVIRFGSEKKKNVEMGIWLDMRGQQWRLNSDNKWEKVNSAD